MESNSYDTKNQQALKDINEDTFEDRAYGCILGAFIGDSCGSFNEFNMEIISDQEMDQCMKMPGGGPWISIASGQITDDSELAMCLLQGIVKGVETQSLNQTLDLDSIAEFYGQWILSPPFDIGNTTKEGLGMLRNQEYRKAQYAISKARQRNQSSISNGSLMRCTPMIVWTSCLQSDFEIYKAVVSDAKFTHPNELVHSSIFLYTKSIHFLLNNHRDPERAHKAFELALKLAQKQYGMNQYDGIKCYDMLQESKNLSESADKLKDDSKFLKENYDARERMGSHTHAIILSFYFLLRFKKNSSQKQNDEFYFKALRETIQLGGDTDTNACIVGGMIGALIGLKKIPQYMINNLLQFDCTKNGILRPEFLSVRMYALKNIQKLIASRPKTKIQLLPEGIYEEQDDSYKICNFCCFHKQQ